VKPAEPKPVLIVIFLARSFITLMFPSSYFFGLYFVVVPDDCGVELCSVDVDDVCGGGNAEHPHQHQESENPPLLFSQQTNACAYKYIDRQASTHVI
jgi:hypothetical protein